MKLRGLRAECRGRLVLSGAARPDYCADLIIAQQTGISRAQLLCRDDDIPEKSCARIFSLIEKRASGVPLAYVLHEAEFLGYRFKVGRGVLIPRPETELLAEAALKYFPSGAEASFADWCTGSGCIAVSLMLENPALSGCAVDKSPQALRWCAINRRLHGLGNRLKLIRNEEPADAPIASQSLDFITANPPYIPHNEMPGLMDEVRLYEPHAALDGGDGGLFLYQKFFKSFPRFLKNGGLLLCETAGNAQSSALERLAQPEFVLVNKISDYNGIIRHLIWRKN